MATKRKRNTAYDKPKKNGGFRGFIKHSLTESEKADFDAWAEVATPDMYWDTVAELIAADYKFGIRKDSYGGGVQANLTCADPEHPDNGLCLTARAPDMKNATMLLLWKHVVLFDCEWNEYYESSDTKSAWG